MIFRNARQAVHDAFATNVTTPDPDARGGTRYNSNAKNAHDAEAGLIIRAALEQKPHLRAACVYINAPDGFATDGDIAALKSRLWRDVMRKHKEELSLLDQGRIVAMLDYLIVDFRTRTHNPSSGGRYRPLSLAKIVRAREIEITGLTADILGILQKYDSQSLQPVWKVVNEQREKHDTSHPKTA